MAFQIMFYGGLVGAIITLSLAVYLFIKLQIASVIEDLTGFSFGKKSSKGLTSYPSETEGNAKPTTSEIKLKRKDVEAEIASAQAIDETELIQDELESTTLLDEEIEGTTILGEVEGTTVLTADDTTLLEPAEDSEDNEFQIKEDILIVHTSETI